MRHNFNIGDMVKIKSPYYIRNGCIGIISAISYFTIDEEAQYEVHIPEMDADICVNESDLVKIPEKGYSSTTQQIKDDINSIYGTSSWFNIWATRNAYIEEDIRRTDEMLKAVGKMIHEREERKMSMTPKKIMRNGPATIVFWEDGTKTVVKKMPCDKDDIYAAFCAAFTKKYFGSNEKVKAVVDSLTELSEEEINDRVIKFNDRFDSEFSKGFSVLITPASLGYDDEHAFNRFLMELSNKGFAVVRAEPCEKNAWSVRRNDVKFIEWIIEHMSSTGCVRIDPKFTNGNMDRMNVIAKELTKDGFKVTCKFSTDYVGGFPYIISGGMVVKKK